MTFTELIDKGEYAIIFALLVFPFGIYKILEILGDLDEKLCSWFREI